MSKLHIQNKKDKALLDALRRVDDELKSEIGTKTELNERLDQIECAIAGMDQKLNFMWEELIKRQNNETATVLTEIRTVDAVVGLLKKRVRTMVELVGLNWVDPDGISIGKMR